MDAEAFEEIMIDHSRRPRNQGALADPHAVAEGSNPETGDWVKVELSFEENKITAIGFAAKGSAVLMASCSMMTVFASGNRAATVLDGIKQFLRYFDNPDVSVETLASMGDVVALTGIRQFPARVKCASLPWRTLREALEGRGV